MAITGQDLVVLFKKRPLPICCGILSVLLLAGTYYRNARTTELEGQLKQNEEEGKRLINNVRFGANLPEHYESLVAQTKQLESRLVRVNNLALNLQYFYRIITESGVTRLDARQTGVAPSPPRGPKPLYPPVGFTVSVKGDYRQIMDFVGRVESGAHFYRWNSCSISRGATEGGAGRAGALTLSLNLDLLGWP